MKTAIYPGSFDPITFGHLDLIERSTKLFDRLIIAIAENPRKKALFSLQDRKKMIVEATKGFKKKVTVDSFRGLTANYVKKQKADAIIRGLRAISDFEYEFQMALANRVFNPHAESVFLTPSREHIFLNSSLVREVAQFGGNVDQFVPAIVKKYLQAKFPKKTNI